MNMSTPTKISRTRIKKPCMAVCTFTASVEEKQERRWCLELTDLLVLLNCYVPDSVRHPVLENKAGRSRRNHSVLASYLHMCTHMHMYTHMLIHTKRKSMKVADILCKDVLPF